MKVIKWDAIKVFFYFKPVIENDLDSLLNYLKPKLDENNITLYDSSEKTINYDSIGLHNVYVLEKNGFQIGLHFGDVDYVILNMESDDLYSLDDLNHFLKELDFLVELFLIDKLVFAHPEETYLELENSEQLIDYIEYYDKKDDIYKKYKYKLGEKNFI